MSWSKAQRALSRQVPAGPIHAARRREHPATGPPIIAHGDGDGDALRRRQGAGRREPGPD